MTQLGAASAGRTGISQILRDSVSRSNRTSMRPPLDILQCPLDPCSIAIHHRRMYWPSTKSTKRCLCQPSSLHTSTSCAHDCPAAVEACSSLQRLRRPQLSPTVSQLAQAPCSAGHVRGSSSRCFSHRTGETGCSGGCYCKGTSDSGTCC